MNAVDVPPPGATAGKPYALVALLQVHWFVRLRWVFAGAALGALAVERFLTPHAQRPGSLIVVVLGVAAINVVWTLTAHLLHRQLTDTSADQRATIRSGQLFVSVQIATDLFLLTCILALTGGIENPMCVFYLFHMAISGLLLRTWQAAIQSAWAVLLYAGMAWLQFTGYLPYYPFLPHLGPAGLHAQPEYIVLLVGINALAIFGTLYFTDRIGKVLDRRESMLIAMNAALERSRQHVQELQRRRSRFMQTAAHQLKTPLAMVQTLADLIRDEIVTDPAGIRATCDKIVRRSREGIGQVSELLALARVQEADPRRHGAALAHVGRIVNDLCARHAPLARGKTLEFRWLAPDVPEMTARVDPADLSDCVGNLIENAIKYTPAGGRVQVRALRGIRRVSLDGPPGYAVRDFIYIVVRDTGIGLDEHQPVLQHGLPAEGSLFEPFRRGNAALAAGIAGSGLGLSIVREVVTQAGGYIHVWSRPNQGSNFTVCFPAATVDQLPAAKP